MEITASALSDNAALFGREAVEQYLLRDSPKGEWRFVAVFAATSLEQLAKAALARRNTLLLADTTETSVLAIAGAPGQDQARTIGATKAIVRYGSFNSRFRTLVPKLRELLDIRNGIVHLDVTLPASFDRVFATFLRAAELLTEDLDLDEDTFWGSALAAVVAARRSELARTIESETERKIATAEARFDSKYRGFSKAERLAAIRAAEASVSGYLADTSFPKECPACSSSGRVDADVEVNWEVEDMNWVGDLTISPVCFHCAVCGLVLEGDEVEWGVPGLDPPPDLSPYDYADPPSVDDIPGLGPEDVHPYPHR